MAIRIIEGRIGSGKTFFAVKHVLDNYFTWDKKKLEWVGRDDVQVYTNIDGMKIGKDLLKAIEQAGGLTNFFTIPYQKKFLGEFSKALYIIDEAHTGPFFHLKFHCQDVFDFFTWCRHVGVDVYLITQDVNNLARQLRDLAEYHIEVKRRTLSLAGEFSYQFKAGGDSFKTRHIRPDKRVFALYKSMHKGEVEKIPSATRRMALIFGVLILAAVLIFNYGFLGMLKPSKAVASTLSDKKTSSASSKVQQGASDNKPLSLLPSSPETPSTPFQEVKRDNSEQGKLKEFTIYMMAKNEDSPGVAYLTPFGNQARFRAYQEDLDLLCRCNFFARYRAGDTVLLPLN